jgi:hypothetical protein
MKHSPGPWVSKKTPGGMIFVYTENLARPICGTGVAGDPTVQANARLIAAAPDLLNAIKLLREAATNDFSATGLTSALEMTDLAIEKACGTTPIPV